MGLIHPIYSVKQASQAPSCVATRFKLYRCFRALWGSTNFKRYMNDVSIFQITA